MSLPTEAIRFIDVEKSFFGIKVLESVSFALAAGQTLGLVGENGAGKSTLMNILGGNLRPDHGRLLLNDEPYTPASPRDAERAGVAFIHQELNLFLNLTIAENLFINRFPRRVRWLPWIDRKTLGARASDLLAQVHLDQSPDTPMDRLSSGERQLVEIAKALGVAARLIIFDEPTTSLTELESRRLFAIMRQLRARGISMIYVSHNLAHVRQLADQIVVLRDGKVVEAAPGTDLPIERLVRLMVGREITQFYPARPPRPQGSPLLGIEHLHQPGILRDITFTLHAGEVLGISGLMGAGRSELARILFGLDPCASGQIRLQGRSLQGLTPQQRIRAGMAFLTEDRSTDGLCANGAIAENLTLASLPFWARTPMGALNKPAMLTAVRDIRGSIQLTPAARNEQPVKTLSGGNQQKVVLGKWLLAKPSVLILDEPTRGIDVGAKQEIYALINHLVAKGAAIIIISSEVEELIGMCDRILVLSQGAIRDCLRREEFDPERIMKAAVHGSHP